MTGKDLCQVPLRCEKCPRLWRPCLRWRECQMFVSKLDSHQNVPFFVALNPSPCLTSRQLLQRRQLRCLTRSTKTMTENWTSTSSSGLFLSTLPFSFILCTFSSFLLLIHFSCLSFSQFLFIPLPSPYHHPHPS